MNFLDTTLQNVNFVSHFIQFLSDCGGLETHSGFHAVTGQFNLLFQKTDTTCPITLTWLLTLLSWCYNVKITILSKFWIELYCINVISIQLSSLLQGILDFALGDSRKGITHNRNQHIKEHHVCEKRCQDEINPKQSWTGVLLISISLEIS